MDLLSYEAVVFKVAGHLCLLLLLVVLLDLLFDLRIVEGDVLDDHLHEVQLLLDAGQEFLDIQ